VSPTGLAWYDYALRSVNPARVAAREDIQTERASRRHRRYSETQEKRVASWVNAGSVRSS
jgi:hypothetical protein